MDISRIAKVFRKHAAAEDILMRLTQAQELTAAALGYGSLMALKTAQAVGSELDLREQFLLDMGYISICVEQVWLVLQRPNDQPKFWQCRALGVKGYESDAKNLAK